MSCDILYIDDDLESGNALIEHFGERVHAWQVTAKELLELDEIVAKLKGKVLVLIDYQLHEFDNVKDQPISEIDGLEFVEKIRAAIRARYSEFELVPILALYTGKFNQLAEIFEVPSDPAFLSSMAGVDWIFQKGNSKAISQNTERQLRSLVGALEKVRCVWGNGRENSANGVFEALNIRRSKSGWERQAFRHFRDLCPISLESMEKSNRVRLVSWLLNVALPFQSCFLDIDDIAISLGVSPVSFQKCFHRDGSKLKKQLSKYRYTGILWDFVDERHWSAGIDDWIWRLQHDDNGKKISLQPALDELTDGEICSSNVMDPVLVRSPIGFDKLKEAVSISDAVQVRPGYWPKELDPPWMRIADLVNDSHLRSFVIDLDLDSIEEQ